LRNLAEIYNLFGRFVMSQQRGYRFSLLVEIQLPGRRIIVWEWDSLRR